MRNLPPVFLARDPFLVAGRTGRWQWYWALLGTMLVAAVYMALVAGLIALESYRSVADWIGSVSAETLFEPGNRGSYLSIGAQFLPMILAPLIVFRCFHRRAWADAPSVWNSRALVEFTKGTLALGLVLMLAFAVDAVFRPERFKLNPLPPGYWAWSVLGLAVLVVQTFAEEALFKGYLMRIWGAVVPYRWPVAILLVALFTSIHVTNTDFAADYWAASIDFIVSGLISFALYFRTHSLAAPTGIHFANNVVAFLIFNREPGGMSKGAIWTYTDPVMAAGQSVLTTPDGALTLVLSNVAFAALLLWHRSPLCLSDANAQTREIAP